MCISGCNDLMTLPSVSASVVNGTNGTNAYFYIASADDDSGTNFTYPSDPTQEYRGFVSSSSILVPVVGDFIGTWTKVLGMDGTNGTNGSTGGTTFNFRFGAAAFIGNPGTGYLNLNTTNTSTATILSISNTDTNSNAIAAVYLAMLSSTSTIKGTIKITKDGDPTKFVVYQVTNYTPGAYGSILITYVTASGTAPFAQNDLINVTFTTTGDIGNTGATGTTGSRTSFPRVYQWAASAPAAPSGTSTYTWATGATTLPGTPGSWTVTVGTPTSSLYNLYTATQAFNDSLTSSTSTITWSSVTVAQLSGIGAGYTASSTTSLTIANAASKTFTVQPNLAYTTGARVRATSAANTTHFMEGICTSYSGTTLIITTDNVGSAGSTNNDWNINLAGDVGAPGNTTMYTSALTVTTALYKNMFSVKQTIIPNSTSKRGIQVICATAAHSAGTAYASNQPVQIVGASTGFVYGTLSASFGATTADTVWSFVSINLTTGNQISISEDLQLLHTVNNPTTGTYDVQFSVTYKYIDFV